MTPRPRDFTQRRSNLESRALARNWTLLESICSSKRAHTREAGEKRKTQRKSGEIAEWNFLRGADEVYLMSS